MKIGPMCNETKNANQRWNARLIRSRVTGTLREEFAFHECHAFAATRFATDACIKLLGGGNMRPYYRKKVGFAKGIATTNDHGRFLQYDSENHSHLCCTNIANDLQVHLDS